MLAKLLKYDLRYIYKTLGIYYVVTILCALVCVATNINNPSGIIEFIHLFSGGASFGLSIGLFVNVITRSWARFQKNFYGDESYLTHTLPVMKRQLLLSKIIASSIALIFSLVVLIFCTIVTQVGFSNLQTFDEMLKSEGFSLLSIGTLLFLTVVLQQLFIILCGFAGILIGHRKNEHRAVWSWAAGIGLYIISNLLIIGFTLIWSLFDTDVHSFIFSGESQSLFSLANICKIIIGIDLVYSIIAVTLYFISEKVLDRGVDVE